MYVPTIDSLENEYEDVHREYRRVKNYLADQVIKESNLKEKISYLSDSPAKDRLKAMLKKSETETADYNLKSQFLESRLKELASKLNMAKHQEFERAKIDNIYKREVGELLKKDIKRHSDKITLKKEADEWVVENKNLPNYYQMYMNFKKADNNQGNDENIINKTVEHFFIESHTSDYKKIYNELIRQRNDTIHSTDVHSRDIFSSNLRFCMNQKHVTMADIANDLDIKYSTLRDWVNGISFPRPSKLRLLADYFNISISELTEQRAKNKIPVLGRIPAGIPIEAIEDIIDYEDIPLKWLNGNKTFFALKISGDSMYPQYLDGDTVIFEMANDCENGQHCAVMVNGDDATFKKVLKNEAGITLMPLNTEKYEPIFYSNKQIKELPITVIAVAREIRRKLF